MGTIVGLILGLLTILAPSDLGLTAFPYVALSIASAFLVVIAIVNGLSLGALQRAETKSSAGIIGIFRRDGQMLLIHGFILSWSLISLFLALTGPKVLGINQHWIVAGWLVLTGIALDLTMCLYRRVLLFVSPVSALQFVQQEALQDLQAGRDVEFCRRIDSLAETGLKAARHDGLSLCQAAIDSVRTTMQQAVQDQKKPLQAAAAGESDIRQRMSYLLHYAGERLAMIYGAAQERGLYSLSQEVISALAKMAVSVAEADLSLVTGPVSFMGGLTKQAVKDQQNQSAGIKLLLTLGQVCRRILSQEEHQGPGSLEKALVPIVKQMDDVAKECFRQNKKIELPRLTSPFQELKKLFEQGRLATHPDQAQIVAQIDRVLADFANVELVMRTVPPLPGVVEGQDGGDVMPTIPENPVL